ncbi:MAG TPA: helix-turn-helix transcriptional regulator [Spirochaetia bacterium]|nr:helix-turn-helix transcriptional regulator [Spirochaetia bacterium]
MIPYGTGEALSMQDGLRLDFIRPFEPVEASHVQADRPGTRVIRPGRSVCLIFSAHGGLVVEDGRAARELQANAALLLEPRGPGLVRLTNRAETDFYLLRFRWSESGLHAGQVLQVPSYAAVLRPARLTHLLRMYIEKAKGENSSEPPNTGVREDSLGPKAVSRTSMLMLHHLLVLALCELARSSQDGILMPAREPGLASIASRVDAFVAAHYHETISSPDIAAELRYNPDYLERAYRQERGMSIREAIHTRRINEARAQLLLLRQQGVAQIAAMCGYTDAGYFRRLFKRATHMTPHGYRAVHPAFLPDEAARAAEQALQP